MGEPNENQTNTFFRFFDIVTKGQKMFQSVEGHKYLIKIPTHSKSCVVNLYDKSAHRWVARIDKPHVRVPYEHININPKYAKIPSDPHIKIPSSGVQAGVGVGNACKWWSKTNETLLYVDTAIDAARITYAVYDDYQNNTTSNTVATVSNVSGTWIGAASGAYIGSAIGSLVLPGLGTISVCFVSAMYGSTVGANIIGPCIENNINRLLLNENQESSADV